MLQLSKDQKDTGKSKQLVGKSVIDQDGCLVGTVKDVAFVPGKAGLSLNVENKDGEIQEIGWESIQGASDFVVLKPVQQNAAQVSATPSVQQTQPQSQPQYMQSPQVAQPVQTANPAQPLCPSCRSPLTWIPQYKQWYCYKEQKYPYAKA